MKIGILGGGLAGLSARCFLNHDTEVLEKEASCGGLCRSLEENGFVFDLGGHILFSRDRRILDAIVNILDGNSEKRRRNNKICYKNRFIKYPFENGLSGLPLKENFECLYHYLMDSYPKPVNFRDWIYFNFGKAIAEKYLAPYNEKIWKFDLEKMGFEWVARVPKPPKADIIKASLGIPTEGYRHQLYYFYPKTGGIQSLIKRLEQKKPDPITKNFTVTGITKEGGRWVVSDGAREKVFDKIISAMPVFDLIKALKDVPPKVLAALAALKYNSLMVVSLGLDTADMPDYTAVYFPDKKAPYHRVCFMNNFSPNAAPSGKSAVVAEITADESSAAWKMPDRDVCAAVITSLAGQGIIDERKVCYSRVQRAKYAYIVYDMEYKKNISVIREFVKSAGIESVGRFAEFEYINMDEVIKRSMALAEKI